MTTQTQTLPPATYTERARTLDAATQAARIADDAAKYQSFRERMAEVQSHTVPAANIARELGLSFQEYYLPPRKESAEAHFNEHYRTRLQMSFAVFEWLIAAARKLPSVCATMADVMPALQMTLFAGELIEDRQRTEPQHSQEVTPDIGVWNCVTSFKTHLERMLVDTGKWEPEMKQEVRGHIAKARQFLNELEAKL